MWTRSLLKENAKKALFGHYWRAFLVCLVAGIFTLSSSAGTARDQMDTAIDDFANQGVWTGNATTGIYSSLTNETLEILRQIGPIILIAALIGIVIGVCLNAFLVMPLSVGRDRFMMENRQGNAPFATLFSAFKAPYMNVVKVNFLVNLKIALGSLIIIPGIYWSFKYMMVTYLLAENPYMTTDRAMELSGQMMDGEKWNAFVLSLSFLGWILLGTLTFGIGLFFLEPYCQATYAELYAALRSKAFAAGYTSEAELGGFMRYE